MIKAVIFDLDDTIIDHKHSFQTSLRHLRDNYKALNSLALPDLEELYQSLLEHFHQYVLSEEYTIEEARYQRFKTLFNRVGGNPTHDEIIEIKAVFGDIYSQEERVITGVVELIQALRNKGVQIGLITNNTSVAQRAKIERHSLEPLLDAIIISGEVGIAKPNREIFDIALNQLDCQVDEVVMIGDSWSSDIVGATSIGMKAVWLNRYNQTNTISELVREITTFTPLNHAMNTLISW